MPTISLTTFMKLCSKTPSSKATAYSKYLTPGGYDFYQRLKVEANAATVLGKSHSDCEEALASIANESERKHNLAGFKALVKWLITESGKFFAPPTALCESPKGFIKVRLKPEFGIETAVGRRLVTLWNTKKPELTSSIAGVGIYLMNQHLLKGDFEDCKSAVLDLRTNRLFVADVLPADVETRVAREFGWADRFFEDAKSPPGAGAAVGLSPP